MLRSTDPVITQAVDAIYVMSNDEKIREAVRLREKRLHDEASALRNAKLEGRAEGELINNFVRPYRRKTKPSVKATAHTLGL